MSHTPDNDDLVTACWRFVDAMRREDSGQLPPLSPTPLEAYLILAYARSQAGLFRSPKATPYELWRRRRRPPVPRRAPRLRRARRLPNAMGRSPKATARVGARMAALSAQE